MAPSVNRHGIPRLSPCKGEGAKQRVHRLRGRVASLEPPSCLQGRRAAKKTGPEVSPGPRIRWPCQMLDLTLTNSG